MAEIDDGAGEATPASDYIALEPITPPPLIFLIGLAIGIVLELAFPSSLLPAVVQYPTGTLIVLCGVRLISTSMRAISDAETTYDPFGVPTVLVTSGPYRYTRNPGYLGLAVIQVGIAVLADSVLILLMTIPAIVVMTQFVIRREEAKLQHAFGDDYSRYRASVRRWI